MYIQSICQIVFLSIKYIYINQNTTNDNYSCTIDSSNVSDDWMSALTSAISTVVGEDNGVTVVVPAHCVSLRGVWVGIGLENRAVARTAKLFV